MYKYDYDSVLEKRTKLKENIPIYHTTLHKKSQQQLVVGTPESEIEYRV